MNLFNKVKKGMLDSTKTIKEISADVTEMTRLKVMLSKEKDQVEELYYNLGKILYTYHEKDAAMDKLPEAVKTAMAEIKQTHLRIQEYEFKLELLKGIVKCSQCGHEVDDDAKFCSNCGNQLTFIFRKEPVQEDVPEDEAQESIDKTVEDVEEFDELEEIKPE